MLLYVHLLLPSFDDNGEVEPQAIIDSNARLSQQGFTTGSARQHAVV